MTITGDLREPAVGSTIRLLPVTSGDVRAGTMTEWLAGPAGLVVTARVDMAPGDVAALAGQRVWARVGTGGGTTVLEAVASAGSFGGELVLTGVLALAHETRRAEPRVGTARRAQLRRRAGAGTAAAAAAAPARTVDLSRTGARLQLPPGAPPMPVGTETVEVTVEVGDSQAVSATAHVVRVDVERQEVAVRFVDLQEDDAQRIDRLVLAELSSQHAGEQRDGG